MKFKCTKKEKDLETTIRFKKNPLEIVKYRLSFVLSDNKPNSDYVLITLITTDKDKFDKYKIGEFYTLDI